MAHLGTLSFQANDNTDVFLVADVVSTDFMPTDGLLLDYQTEEMDAQPGYITGRLPQKTSVTVSADTSVLSCIYRATELADFEMTIYIEYEEVEKLNQRMEEVPDRPVSIIL